MENRIWLRAERASAIIVAAAIDRYPREVATRLQPPRAA
jgi:hypothetical protein